jgi:hypothetical protein
VEAFGIPALLQDAQKFFQGKNCLQHGFLIARSLVAGLTDFMPLFQI